MSSDLANHLLKELELKKERINDNNSRLLKLQNEVKQENSQLLQEIRQNELLLALVKSANGDSKFVSNALNVLSKLQSSEQVEQVEQVEHSE